MQFKNNYRYVEFVEGQDEEYRSKYYLREKSNSDQAYENFKTKELEKRDERLLQIEQVLKQEKYKPQNDLERPLTEKDFEIERKNLTDKEKNFNLKEYEVLKEALRAFLHTNMQEISFVDKHGISVNMLRCDNYFNVVQKYIESKAKAQNMVVVFKSGQEAIEELKKIRSTNLIENFGKVTHENTRFLHDYLKLFYSLQYTKFSQEDYITFQQLSKEKIGCSFYEKHTKTGFLKKLFDGSAPEKHISIESLIKCGEFCDGEKNYPKEYKDAFDIISKVVDPKTAKDMTCLNDGQYKQKARDWLFSSKKITPSQQTL